VITRKRIAELREKVATWEVKHSHEVKTGPVADLMEEVLAAAEFALELRERLVIVAAEKATFDRDDWNAHDAFGGNMDDAYEGGVSDGRIELARELLSK
jgi:hypothetical protein